VLPASFWRPTNLLESLAAGAPPHTSQRKLTTLPKPPFQTPPLGTRRLRRLDFRVFGPSSSKEILHKKFVQGRQIPKAGPVLNVLKCTHCNRHIAHYVCTFVIVMKSRKSSALLPICIYWLYYYYYYYVHSRIGLCYVTGCRYIQMRTRISNAE